MNIEAIQELREMLYLELEEISDKHDLSNNDLETVHKLTDTIKNIDKICMFECNGDYSTAEKWEIEGKDSYGKGNNYVFRRSGHSRPHYSLETGSNRMRDRRGRYSSSEAKGYLISQLEDLMQDTNSEREREAIRRCKDELEKA